MKKILYILSAAFALSACSEHDSIVDDEYSTEIWNGEEIRIAGVETSVLEISANSGETRGTRALLQDAETVPWLVNPLKYGLDITYGKVGSESATKKVAILKLSDTNHNTGEKPYDYDAASGLAKYTFKYKDNGENAIWHGNGAHFFEGVYVPDELRYGSAYNTASGSKTPAFDRTQIGSVNNNMIPNMLTDQSSDAETGAYTLLTHYLAMPANTRINATVGRVKLPFRHRLARIKAYVLIDPEMGGTVTLKGFNLENGKDSPSSTALRFCNVEVLEGVEDTKSSDDTHVLTPQWKTPKKIIPHFLEMSGSKNGSGTEVDSKFMMFYDDKTMSYIFPTDEKWAEYKAMDETTLESKKITKTIYGTEANGYKVPVYDLIVRPTYTSADSIMYDEDLTNISTSQLETHKNKVEFELTLSNGLVYKKEIEFDLDANYQTVIYLRISRESVDYNASGSVLWQTTTKNDAWYGVDNTEGHSLSKAGSSWQRAYTYGWNVTNKPDALKVFDKVDEVTDGGFYNEITTPGDGVNGQYLTDNTWIKTFAQAYEGGAHHGDYFILTKDIDIDVRQLPVNFVFTGHLDAQGHKITLKGTNTEVVDKEAWDEPLPATLYRYVDAVKYSQDEINEALAIVTAEDYVKGTNPEAEELSKKTTDDVKEDAYYSPFAFTSWSDIKNATEELYSDDQGHEYVVPNPIHHPKESHTSSSALFAGLNGNYEAEVGTANVHKENNVLVPYRTPDSDYSQGKGSGWRAEVINLDIKGKLFKDGAVITGNVQNCYEVSEGGTRTKFPNHTPALPKYN